MSYSVEQFDIDITQFESMVTFNIPFKITSPDIYFLCIRFAYQYFGEKHIYLK